MNNTSNRPQTILVLTSSSTGNNVFCTPAIRLLRKYLPHAMIDVVALNKLSAEVFEGSLDINKLYVLEGARKFDKLAKNYEKVICLNTNALKKVRGTQTKMEVIPNYVNGIARAEQQLGFMAQWLGVAVTDKDRKYVIGSGKPEDFSGLDKHHVQANDVLVSLHLGCGTTLLHGWKFFYKGRAEDERLWSIERYIALGQALIQENPNIRIIITGTKNESFLAKQFEKNVPGTINLVGKTSVKNIFDFMHEVSLFVAHDCGIFHVASATEVPIVGLYGATDSILAGPFPVRPQHHIIEAKSMADISVDQVVQAAVLLLKNYPKK